MMMLFRRVFRRVLPHLLFSALGIGLIAARALYLGRPYFLFLVWNLFLAWVPLFFALGVERLSQPERDTPEAGRWGARSGNARARGAWACGLAWLAFFPNAPYLVTDFVHLRARAPVPLWYDVAMLAVMAAAGLFLGLASLAVIHRQLSLGYGRAWAWLTVGLVCSLSGYAIYLGRFLRWNSWDLVASPSLLAQDLYGELPHVRTWAVSVVYGAFIFASYVAYWDAGRRGRSA